MATWRAPAGRSTGPALLPGAKSSRARAPSTYTSTGVLGMPCTTYTEPVSCAVAAGAVTRVVAAAASSPPRARVRRRMVRPSGSGEEPFNLNYRRSPGSGCTTFEQLCRVGCPARSSIRTRMIGRVHGELYAPSSAGAWRTSSSSAIVGVGRSARRPRRLESRPPEPVGRRARRGALAVEQRSGAGGDPCAVAAVIRRL